MSKVPANLKVCIFDVFGTVVDWRGSLIEDLPVLGRKYGIETDWTSFADDWRGLYQPQMGRVRKGELPWTRIDDLHKEAFEMLLAKRGLKHPGDEGAWEFTHLWHKLRPWPDSVEGIGMMKKKFVGGQPKNNRPKDLKGVPTRSAESDALSKALQKAGFKFVGSTICYAFMQASGMVDDHVAGCHCAKE